jgi:hypothetical protein
MRKIKKGPQTSTLSRLWVYSLESEEALDVDSGYRPCSSQRRSVPPVGCKDNGENRQDPDLDYRHSTVPGEAGKHEADQRDQ